MNTWKGILLGLGIAIAVSISFFVGEFVQSRKPLPVPEARIDTLIVRDTFTIKEPVYRTRRVIDSVMVAVTDTIMVHDTTYIYLDREQVTWRDSLCEVYASGIYPQVDSVVHFTSQMVIGKEIPVVKVQKTRWGVGFQVGAGMAFQGKRVIGSPYIGVGISYNLFTW